MRRLVWVSAGRTRNLVENAVSWYSVIMKTRLYVCNENFTTNNWKFCDKNSDIVHISAQNIDCGFSLEPPHGGGSNEYTQTMLLSRNPWGGSNEYPQSMFWAEMKK